MDKDLSGMDKEALKVLFKEKYKTALELHKEVLERTDKLGALYYATLSDEEKERADR